MREIVSPRDYMDVIRDETGVFSRQERLWLLAWLAGYAILTLAFYPAMYTSLDESANFGMACVLRHGTIYPLRAGYLLSMCPGGPFGPVYRFPIGYPACLALASFAGCKAMFAINPILHLAATWFFGRLLRRLNLPISLCVLYLFYPGFVLYDRTIFSDGFAASLTTIALFCLLQRRTTLTAGLFMGLALTARSTSQIVALILTLGLLWSEMRRGEKAALRESSTLRFVLGLLPFLLINGIYNACTSGSFFQSTYSAAMLSPENFLALAPLYASSLLLIFPGMLLGPFFYRGRFWREGLAATTAVFLLAASYYETTYGGSQLGTLLSVSRQMLPVLPFYLLAYCGVLSTLRASLPRPRLAGKTAGFLLMSLAAGISFKHQQYLHVLTSLQREIRQTLPRESVIYGNKDVFKLHQPLWETTPYREIGGFGATQMTSDLKRSPVFVVLYIRSRGVPNEDAVNQEAIGELKRRVRLGPGPPSSSGMLHYYRVLALR